MYARYHTGDECFGLPMVRDAILTLTAAEIEEKTGMTSGCSVADVDVENADGTYSRFFLSVRINKRGQPVFEVATSYASDRTVSKSVVGAKRKMIANASDKATSESVVGTKRKMTANASDKATSESVADVKRPHMTNEQAAAHFASLPPHEIAEVLVINDGTFYAEALPLDPPGTNLECVDEEGCLLEIQKKLVTAYFKW